MSPDRRSVVARHSPEAERYFTGKHHILDGYFRTELHRRARSQGGLIRVSFAQQIAITDYRGRSLLIIDPKTKPPEYIPIGGATHLAPEGRMELTNLFAASKFDDTELEMRFWMPPGNSEALIRWFREDRLREPTPDLELFEEVTEETGLLDRKDLKLRNFGQRVRFFFTVKQRPQGWTFTGAEVIPLYLPGPVMGKLERQAEEENPTVIFADPDEIADGHTRTTRFVIPRMAICLIEPNRVNLHRESEAMI